MAIEMINVGAAANDGTGDDLREAFVKINQNFEDLDLRIDDKTEGANVGSGAGVFKQRQGYDLQFKSIVGGDNVTVTEFENQITLAATGGLQNLIFVTDSGSVHVTDGQTVRIQGGTGINTEYDGTAIRLNNTKLTQLNEDSTPTLGADLNGNLRSIFNVDEITANIVNAAINGNVIGNVHGIDVRTHDPFFTELDFGGFGTSITNWYDLIREAFTVELGTIDSPASIDIDAGTF